MNAYSIRFAIGTDFLGRALETRMKVYAESLDEAVEKAVTERKVPREAITGKGAW